MKLKKRKNGYYVTKDNKHQFSYFNHKNEKITASEFEKKCPTIFESLQGKNIARGNNGYYLTKHPKDGFFCYNAQDKRITAEEFKKNCPNIYKTHLSIEARF